MENPKAFSTAASLPALLQWCVITVMVFLALMSGDDGGILIILFGAGIFIYNLGGIIWRGKAINSPVNIFWMAFSVLMIFFCIFLWFASAMNSIGN